MRAPLLYIGPKKTFGTLWLDPIFREEILKRNVNLSLNLLLKNREQRCIINKQRELIKLFGTIPYDISYDYKVARNRNVHE